MLGSPVPSRLPNNRYLNSLVTQPAKNPRRNRAWLSPLRYPGSKRRLVPYIEALLDLNGLEPELFVEPFAGGASVALQLLGQGRVPRIGIADRDPLIASFWRVVFSDPDWLIAEIERAELSVARWRYYRRLIGRPDLTDRDRAIACLFLNRTSFSGILSGTAGPIGGPKQDSTYTIDCRFPRRTLIRRVQQLTELADRVAFVWNTSWRATFARIFSMQERGALSKNVFYYLDPPFFHKADRLYAHYFLDRHHQELRRFLESLEAPWLLSYDVCDQVWDQYAGNGWATAQIDLLYNTPSNGNYTVASEAVISNQPVLPADVAMWHRTSRRSSSSTLAKPLARQQIKNGPTRSQ